MLLYCSFFFFFSLFSLPSLEARVGSARSADVDQGAAAGRKQGQSPTLERFFFFFSSSLPVGCRQSPRRLVDIRKVGEERSSQPP